MNKTCVPNIRDIINSEIPVIKKMIQDECWYEGQRRGHAVDEAEISSRINDILIEVGEKIKNKAVEELINSKCEEHDHDCSKCPYFRKAKGN